MNFIAVASETESAEDGIADVPDASGESRLYFRIYSRKKGKYI